MIKNNFKNYLLKLSHTFGYNIQIGKITSPSDLNKLLKQLYPISIDIPLIRVGSDGDGGYLVPDDLENINYLFSPGVGCKQDFDHECADKGMKVCMVDASVNGPIKNHTNFNFLKKYLGVFDSDETISLDSWLRSSQIPADSECILQMDIEGGEYESILSASLDTLSNFRIMIIEFHKLDMLWNRHFFNFFKNCFLKLLQTHYVTHIHPNNCTRPTVIRGLSIPPVMEFTFIRKDRVIKTGYVKKFPNDLDRDCTPKKSLTLPGCWYDSKNA